ncbi:unknown protein [Nostoc sp. NIES-3756]|uniref:hypothetical protein n=1 Tax=Nostoc sp. NIES-3756 TaxID=1751286 RepID=UPI00071EAA4D|nr:hypothetical protein [Nostoc sp. NIES-3756]BAT52194.1 unknown protein [Nostoc sp. NIES-3756]
MDQFFSDFIKGTKSITMQLKIEDKPCKASSIPKLENGGNQKIYLPYQTVELPPVFSHMNFLLIETLSATRHGEFITRSKQAKYETIVELGGHISHRYGLTQQEVEDINKIYNQVLEMWIAWRLANKKS